MAIIGTTSQPSLGEYGLMQETTSWSNDYNDSMTVTETIEYKSFRKRDEHWANIEVAINAALFFVIVFGNGIVVAVLWRRRKSFSRMHFFIFNLCIADLTMAFFNTLPQMIWDMTYQFLAPDFVCRIVKLLQLVPVYLSSYILVVTAIDRYIAICHPMLGLRGNYKGPMRFMIVMCWVIAFVCSSPQMSIFSLVDREKHPDKYWPDCRASFKYPLGPRAYITFFTLAVYIIPSFILAVMYGLICVTVWKNMETTYGKKSSRSPQSNTNWENDESDRVGSDKATDSAMKLHKQGGKGDKPAPLQCRRHGGKVTQAKVKTVKMTIVIVSAYIICWTPFFVTQMMSVWGAPPKESLTYTIVMLLSTLNSAINPWIYFAFSANAARDIEQVLFCCFARVPRGGGARSSTTRPGDDNSSRYVSGARTVYSDLHENGRRKIPTDAEQQATRTALLNQMAE